MSSECAARQPVDADESALVPPITSSQLSDRIAGIGEYYHTEPGNKILFC
jgi:hypothetical protein